MQIAYQKTPLKAERFINWMKYEKKIGRKSLKKTKIPINGK